MIDSRNKFCIDVINNLRKQYGRKILILSDRLAHLKILKEGVDVILNTSIANNELEPDEFKTAYYIGKMKDYELNEATEADMIFATYGMAEEGLDIDKLNTLVFATPKRNIIQSIGRIMRKPINDGDIKPLVVDIVDGFSVFHNWVKTRRKYYENKKYTISFYQAYNDKCVNLKKYLKINGIIKSEQQDVDIRKAFMCHKYGENYYDLEKETGFVDDPKDKYNYKPDLNDIFNMSTDTEESDDIKELCDKIITT
jgi:superfamily II DNA or RNA helicase